MFTITLCPPSLFQILNWDFLRNKRLIEPLEAKLLFHQLKLNLNSNGIKLLPKVSGNGKMLVNLLIFVVFFYENTLRYSKPWSWFAISST